ncbi:DUF2147 domain-containing protein [Cognatishimia sp. MH4019]|uniref:DUF2147 domain-containing protein n=1 Tax=Cognatishimia sp. MH4019 TaxID=2854030 RepID=UPI001CD6D0A0|nr:DUF2147 domain-containing protein [Cognatishimia sp. MH4019]
MKRITLIAAACLLAGAASADPVAGTWKTQPGDDGAYGHVTVAPCGSAICGTIAKAFNASGQEIASDNIGKRMIWDMKAKGGGSYSGGRIWAPDRDKTYNSKMNLSGNSLKVEGCVLGICRGQTWTRVN